MHQTSMTGLLAAALTVGIAFSVSAAPIVFSDGGSENPGDIQATVDSFRAALGNPNNANNPGPLPGGRREINWDGGGGVSTTTPPVTPFTVFQNTRGGLFTTPGTGLTQATPEGLGILVGNPTYTTTFGTFSPLRLFAPIGSNITSGQFSIPGTNGTLAAAVSGFGAVFTDVDQADTTKIEFLGGGGVLFSAFVPVGTSSNASLSFLGVVFDAGELISGIRITTGNTALGPTDGAGGADVVVMDDFLYGEPVAVPAPGGLALFGLGVGLLFIRARRRRAV